MQKKIDELKNVYKKLLSLQKRNSEKEIEKRKNFTEDVLPYLFDIMPIDVISIIEGDKKRTKEDQTEDINFINDQRSARNMFIGSADQRYITSAQRSQHEIERTRNIPRPKSVTSIQQLSSSTSSETEESSAEITIESDNN